MGYLLEQPLRRWMLFIHVMVDGNDLGRCIFHNLDPKKRGRLKGSINKLSPEIERKLGDAALHYAYGRFKDAINILLEVVQIAPNISNTYHTLGLVHNSMGDKHKAMDFYGIAAIMNPKESSVWTQLVNWSMNTWISSLLKIEEI
ncbi:uncharacterized protein LOC110695996 [Chenopodium quinoa]|uniref:uncharacterized protein LOC110695996 n=1 Tax=Chenopodium quinoa TaxID=63459 RepID=UPI000B77789B|nr:uncharacterized protein LOC110695996 [Chenopodium quinoa]